MEPKQREPTRRCSASTEVNAQSGYIPGKLVCCELDIVHKLLQQPESWTFSSMIVIAKLYKVVSLSFINQS